MTMDWLYEQMETSRPVTEKDLSEMKSKNFTSGKQIKIGDIIFYGLRLDEGSEPDELHMELITFHKDEIHQKYKSVDQTESHGIVSPFPILKVIG